MASTSSISDISSLQPPRSSPGHDDPTAGIPANGGGLSSTAYIESPVQNTSSSTAATSSTTTDGDETGLVASLKNILGLGGSGSTGEEANTQSALSSNEPLRAEDKSPAVNATTYDESTATETAAGTATVAAAAIGGGTYLNYKGDNNIATPSSGTTTTLPDRSVTTSTTSGATDSNPPPSTAAHTDPIAPSADALPSHTSSSTSKQDTTNTSSSSKYPDLKDGPTSSTSIHDPKGESGDKEASVSAKGKGPQVGNVENKDSIPTAGGERLGEKHWGESKIVPEDPGKGAGAGVEGSGNSAEVRDNTAKNTGSATSGPHGHGNSKTEGGNGSAAAGEDGKPGVMDKVKDKLNIGKK